MKAPVRTITVKVDDRLRKRRALVNINWPRHILQAIVERIEQEERKRAAQALLEGIRKHVVPRGFMNQAIRGTRINPASSLSHGPEDLLSDDVSPFRESLAMLEKSFPAREG